MGSPWGYTPPKRESVCTGLSLSTCPIFATDISLNVSPPCSRGHLSRASLPSSGEASSLSPCFFQSPFKCALGESQETLLNLWEVLRTGRRFVPVSVLQPWEWSWEIEIVFFYSGEVLSFWNVCTLYICRHFSFSLFISQIVFLLHL